jgi:predicted AAA+ superfamily ATPase
MSKYYDRLADIELKDRLERAGAVLVRGPKGCGKTETARKQAKSEIVVDDSEAISQLMSIDSRLLLTGDTPRLIDEWQEQPRLWNTIRHEIDARQQTSQFILTGSANPEEQADLHSGFGRFAIMNMRPLSLYEARLSTGSVSLGDLLRSTTPETTPQIEYESHENPLSTIADWICVGGWPAHLRLSNEQAILAMRDNVELMAEVDLSRVSQKKRDPLKIRRLLRSIARNNANEGMIETLRKDAAGTEADLAYETVVDYISAMERIMILDNLDAWSTHITSSATLRKSRKFHFVDPSIAVAILGLDQQRIMDDILYMGLLFESLVIRDLKIYAQHNDASVYHYRDSSGKEVDAIVENRDGTWAAFEIKLGFNAASEGGASLLRFADIVDTENGLAPVSLNVITGSGIVSRSAAGVNIIPITALTA